MLSGLGNLIWYPKHDEGIEKNLELIDDCRIKWSKRHPKHKKKFKKEALEKSNHRVVEVANNFLFNEH